MNQLLDFSDAQRDGFGQRTMVARHRLHELGLVTDDRLVDILDNYPLERRQAFTMGTNKCHREDWHFVDTRGRSGKELLKAVVRGRLWLNLLRVDLVDRRFGEALAQLRTELTEQCPRMGLLEINFGTLIISSPSAMVYYHFDASHQSLWHLRGSKRIWIYPACDPRFASTEVMEDIFAGSYDYDEEIPYSPDFDRYAEAFDLRPGDVASWPLNAPHRIENLENVNVSLSTGFVTEAGDRRSLVYLANRLLRRRLGLRSLSTRETGVAASMKCLFSRLCRRAGFATPPHRRPYVTDLEVDPDVPLGVRPRRVVAGPEAPA